MAGFGIPSAWGQPTPAAKAAPKPPASSTIWGRPATRTGGLGGFTTQVPGSNVNWGLMRSPPPLGQKPASAPAIPPTAPAAPAAPQTPATSPDSSSTASPLDSTYYDNLAANKFKVGNQINALNSASANSTTALQSALDQLAYQQPRDQLKLEQSANRSGGLYSSVEAQNQADLVKRYGDKSGAATADNGQKQAAIATQIKALQDGVPYYEAQQYDDAVARAIKAAASNPATGQDTGSSTPSVPSAPGPNSGYGPTATPTPAQARAGNKVNWGLLRKPPPPLVKPPLKPNFALRSRRPGGWS